jgi:hypothetical protein
VERTGEAKVKEVTGVFVDNALKASTPPPIRNYLTNLTTFPSIYYCLPLCKVTTFLSGIFVNAILYQYEDYN